jgi:hypothetical protein
MRHDAKISARSSAQQSMRSLHACIAANPAAFRRVRGETRRGVLKRFPYAIYFRASGKEIIILAIYGGRIRHAGRLERKRSFSAATSSRTRGLT